MNDYKSYCLPVEIKFECFWCNLSFKTINIGKEWKFDTMTNKYFSQNEEAEDIRRI